MAVINNQRKIQHLLLRAGFGDTPTYIVKNSSRKPNDIVNELFKKSKNYTELRLFEEADEMFQVGGVKNKEEKAGIFKRSQERLKQLNLGWMEKLVSDDAQLREKMVLFWHSHFSCKGINAYFMQNQLNTIRKHALGKFSDLLLAMCKDPAMLLYLSNHKNIKGKVDVGFARELLNVFTLGRGTHSEKDTKDVARAFTGWGFDPNGNFLYNEASHDADAKIFLGIRGNFTGEEIINIILQQKQTAKFITTKIYRYFVNENIDGNHIYTLSENFFKSGYDLSALMKEIFTSSWFYEDKNIGVLIKSPIELLVNMKRTFGITFEDNKHMLFLQKVLGQVLLYPTNAAGWSSGKELIDSSSLMLRLRLPEYIFNAAEIKLFPKEDGDIETDYLSEKDFEVLRPLINWAEFGKPFMGQGQEKMLEGMANFLLQHPLNKKQVELIVKETDKIEKSNPILIIALKITSLPEYQLC
ncbi:MAG: DUF1800 domain-containing protein [Cytophagales bacterium]|nr:MAG: DUF1800 domain-containing protein [Cytophagales bacterium]